MPRVKFDSTPTPGGLGIAAQTRPTSSTFAAAIGHLSFVHEQEVALLREEILRLTSAQDSSGSPVGSYWSDLAAREECPQSPRVAQKARQDGACAACNSLGCGLCNIRLDFAPGAWVDIDSGGGNGNGSSAKDVEARTGGRPAAVPKSAEGRGRKGPSSPRGPPPASRRRPDSPAEKRTGKSLSDLSQAALNDDDEETSKPQSFLEWFMGTPLDLLATVLILVNTFVMLTHSQYIGYTNRVKLKLEPDDQWPHAELVFESFEMGFTVLFLSELALRLYWNGLQLLCDPMNLIDATVVFTTTLDTFILAHLDFKAGLGVVRLIRMVKLAKTLKVARAMKLFEPLRILMRTIAGSILSLFWSMIILIMFMLVGAILTSQMLQNFVVDEAYPLEHRLWVDLHYGDAWKALWTMFEITLSGGWPNWVTPLVRNVSIGYAVFFGVYVSIVVFAVIRVITALFLKSTLAEAAKDADMQVQEKIKSKQALLDKLCAIFKAGDKDRDGVLHEHEFYAAIRDRKISKMFVALDMEPDQLGAAFHILDDGDGVVSLDEFLDGIMRMRGGSRATDLLRLMKDHKEVMKNIEILKDHLGINQDLSRKTSSR